MCGGCEDVVSLLGRRGGGSKDLRRLGVRLSAYVCTAYEAASISADYVAMLRM